MRSLLPSVPFIVGTWLSLVHDASAFVIVRTDSDAQLLANVPSTSFHSAATTTPQSTRHRVLFATAAEEAASVKSDTANTNDARALLLDAIGFNAAATSALLAKISTLRETKSPQDVTQFLQELLETGPDASLPFWTRSKRLARFSKRARYASLRRMLDRTTPPPSDSENENEAQDTVERQQQRRRRALIAVLRSLEAAAETATSTSKVPAIVVLERNAIRESQDSGATAEELRSRLPEGLETPAYEVVATLTAAVEIRTYQPYAVCSVAMNAPRPANAVKEKTDAKVQMPELGGASSFGALAGYLFGKNDQSTAMKMTTPVFTTTTTASGVSLQDENEKQMEFVLPSEYWKSDTFNEAPQPLEGSGVQLQQVVSETRAVLMFGGYASKKEVSKRKEQLKAALLSSAKKGSEWGMISDDTNGFALAQYNDPFTVPWKRLNEVSVPVIMKKESAKTTSEA